MNLFELLKQFKNIEPDRSFSEHSKRVILTSPKTVKHTGGFMIFLRTLETSVAVVLAGFFVLIITGGFLGSKNISPVQYSVIDPQGLHAEAQAIDMQIQLANLYYPEGTSTVAQSTAPTASASQIFLREAAVLGSATSSTSTSLEDATSTATSTLSVDQALEKLSE